MISGPLLRSWLAPRRLHSVRFLISKVVQVAKIENSATGAKKAGVFAYEAPRTMGWYKLLQIA